MNVEAFLLCDCATDQQGKLNVLGAFDVVYARQTPAKHPACAVVARVRFSKIEEGEHTIRINVIDEDGNPAGPELQDSISIKIPENENSWIRNLILNIHGLPLKKFGEYRIDFAIDGRQEASLPLKVRQIPEQS